MLKFFGGFGGVSSTSKRKRNDEPEETVGASKRASRCTSTMAGNTFDHFDRRAYLVMNDSRNNSTPQSPLGGHDHNMRMRRQASNLPDWLLLRIFAQTDLLQEDVITLPVTDKAMKLHLSILYVCHRWRQLAVPLYYHLNRFEIVVSNFNGAAFQHWWNKAMAERDAVVDAHNKLLAEKGAPKEKFDDGKTDGGDMDDDEDPLYEKQRARHEQKSTAAVEQAEGTFQPRKAMDRYIQPLSCNGFFQASDYKYPKHHQVAEYLLAQAEAQNPYDFSVYGPGVTLDVRYEPHWTNLKSWFRLFHSGQVPAPGSHATDYRSSNRDLIPIMSAFKTIAGYKGCEFSMAEKAFDGIRQGLEYDDERWGLEAGLDAEIAKDKMDLDEAGAEDETETVKGDKEMDGGEEEADQDHGEMEEDTHPACSTYRAPSEVLGSGFFRRN